MKLTKKMSNGTKLERRSTRARPAGMANWGGGGCTRGASAFV